MSSLILVAISLIALLEAVDVDNALTPKCPGDTACITVVEPVCCDGETYSNKCVANNACASNCVDGACVTKPDCSTIRCMIGTVCCDKGNGFAGCCDCESQGMCEDSTGACNTKAACLVDPCDNQLCPDGQECRSDYCGGCNALCEDIIPTKPATTGCTPNPNVMCTAVYTPVCCDGTTYSNPCVAGSACASNCVDGACVIQTKPATTDKPATTGCTPNTVGNCLAQYLPVCCDGTTYSNKCVAGNACASNCVDGACVIQTKPATTDKPETTGCTPTKDACPDVYDPVCCDGVKFGNKCEANRVCASNCVDGACVIKPDCSNIRCMSGTVCCDKGNGVSGCCDCKSQGMCEDPTGACNTEVQCLANPCDTDQNQCTDSQICTADYCGGCNAICEDIQTKPATTDNPATTDKPATTESPKGCTEDALVCSDGTVLTRSAKLDCDWDCEAADGCDATVCCDGEPMAECVANNECDAGFKEMPGACTDDVYTCPDGVTSISRNECCEFDKDECDVSDPDYCDAVMVKSKRATWKEVDGTESAKQLGFLGRCQFCLCSEEAQAKCNGVYEFSEWDETNIWRQRFTTICLENTDKFTALAADKAGTQCEWSDIRVKEVDDIEECYCTAFYCEGTPYYDGEGFDPSLVAQGGANQYGVMTVIGFVTMVFYWM